MPDRNEVVVSIYKPQRYGPGAAWLVHVYDVEDGEEYSSAATSLAAAKRHALAILRLEEGIDRARLPWKEKNGMYTATVWVNGS